MSSTRSESPATNTPLCRHNAKGNSEPGCGKAALGVATLAIIGAAGVFIVGCGLAKGADCILDGNVGVGGTELTRQGAEYYVGRYNEALGHPERTSVPLEPTQRNSPVATSQLEHAPE